MVYPETTIHAYSTGRAVFAEFSEKGRSNTPSPARELAGTACWLSPGRACLELPESLKKHIEAIAAREGYTVSQLLASAAGEKLAVVLTMDYLRREAAAGRRADFDKYLAAVPDVPPSEVDRLA